jgi:hypothetical protein
MSTAELLQGDGVPVHITSKYGTCRKSLLQIDRKEANIEPNLLWSGKYNCELSFVTSISAPVAIEDGLYRINVNFSDFCLTFDVAQCYSADVFTILTEMHKKAMYIRNLERDYNLTKASNHVATTYPQTMVLKASLCKAITKEEQLQQLVAYLKYKEGYILLERSVFKYRQRLTGSAFKHWVSGVRDENEEKMDRDRSRWRLHATSNLDVDLQAWYHALFFKEVRHIIGSHAEYYATKRAVICPILVDEQ